MTLQVWLAFVLLETVLCLSPGPAVLFVISTTLGRGPRAGLGGALGIVACNLFYFLLSALGVAAVILASHRLFTVLKWLGAAYLVYLGVRMLWSRARAADSRPIERVHMSLSSALLRGFGVQAANPKALAFFVALLPQFVDPHGSVARQIAILAVTSIAIEFGVLSFYIWIANRAGALARGKWSVWLERAAGGFLVAAGARLALVRSP